MTNQQNIEKKCITKIQPAKCNEDPQFLDFYKMKNLKNLGLDISKGSLIQKFYSPDGKTVEVDKVVYKNGVYKYNNDILYTQILIDDMSLYYSFVNFKYYIHLFTIQDLLNSILPLVHYNNNELELLISYQYNEFTLKYFNDKINIEFNGLHLIDVLYDSIVWCLNNAEDII